ncbi:MAG: hypothetical protein WCK89_11590 [bacterium]
MRATDEIKTEIAHIEFARALLNERLTALKAERDQHRADEHATATITKRLAEFFKAHGLYIVDVNHGERTESHYDLAKQIWRSRKVLIPFVKCLSNNMTKSFSYDTSKVTLVQKNDIRNFCHVLANKNWLTFTQSDKSFEIVPSMQGEQRDFVQGIWAEEVTLYLIVKALNDFTKKRHLKHKLFWDLKLKQIDPVSTKAVDMQLDLVAQVGDRFYVFETKAGVFLMIHKWVDRARLFDDGKNRFFTCTADENLNRMMFKPFRLLTLAKLEQQLTSSLQRDFPLPSSNAISSLN